MNILIAGTGYVGLVTAASFAQMGHHVLCLDIDAAKIAALQEGVLPIYEPGLQELVDHNVAEGRLQFTTDYAEGVAASSICFIAVPTPSSADGACDLSYVLSAAAEIARHMTRDQIIVNKSTVPVGTANRVREHVAHILETRGCDVEFDVVSNPEFLKEGCAIHDCLKPDRIILGVQSPKPVETLRALYAPLGLGSHQIFVMDTDSAELTKYAANAMLALRISFMNELALLCEKTGAHIEHVRQGIGSDPRIGSQFLLAGAGYGGSCFPKDIRALSSMAKKWDVKMEIAAAVERVNARQKQLLGNKILTYFDGNLSGKKIALWGLAFKPGTDDMREAPSLELIRQLLEGGAHVCAYDPIAMVSAKKILKDTVEFAESEYAAAAQADALVLITEWSQFREVDFEKILTLVKGKAFFDGRNHYAPNKMRDLGFDYFGIGVPSLCLQGVG